MPYLKHLRELYWDDQGFILHPKARARNPWTSGTLSTKHYPWRRVRSLEFLPLYPLVRVVAKDPNGAHQIFILGFSQHRDDGRNQLSKLRKIGNVPDLAQHIEEFVAAVRQRKAVQVKAGGWSGHRKCIWEKVPGFPGEQKEAVGSVYRRAAAPEEKVLWSSMRPEPPGWVERMAARFTGRNKLHAAANRIIDPREILITKSFLYVRVGKNSYRMAADEYRGSVVVVGLDGVNQVLERHYFGASAHLCLRRGSGREELTEALIEHLPSRGARVAYPIGELRSGTTAIS